MKIQLYKVFLILLIVLVGSLTISCTNKSKQESPKFNYTSSFINSDALFEENQPKFNDDQILEINMVGLLNDWYAPLNQNFNNVYKYEEKDKTIVIIDDKPTVITTYKPGCSILYEYDVSTHTMKYLQLKAYKNGTDNLLKTTSRFSFSQYLGSLNHGTLVFLEHNLAYTMEEQVPLYKEEDLIDNRWYLTTYDASGIMTRSNLLYDIDKQIGDASISIYSSNNFCMTPDGMIYIASAPTSNNDVLLAKITAEGEHIATVSLKEACPDFASRQITFESLMTDSDGSVCVIFSRMSDTGYTKDEYCHAEDLLSKTNCQTTRFRQELGGKLLYFSETTAYFNNIYGIYRENVGEEGCEEILNWLDIDISGYSVSKIQFDSPEHMLLTYIDPYDFSSYFVDVARTDDPFAAERKVITVAYDETPHSGIRAARNLLNIASRFNRSNEEYRIKLIPYNTDNASTANEKLVQDIITGNIPDMILFGGTISPEPFLRLNVTRDMYKFIDKDKQYNRDAFLPCALEPFENAKGKLPYLPLNITFHTIAGLTNTLSDTTTWTMDDFASFAKTLNNGQYLIKTEGTANPQLALFELLLPAVVDQYINYEKQSCDFSGDFQTLLEVCKDVPVKAADGYLDTYDYLNGDILLGELSIDVISFFLRDRFAMFGEESINMVGVPRNDNAVLGTSIVSDMAFSIMQSCSNPDGAWAFIKYYLASGPEQWDTFVDRPQIIYFADGFLPTWETTERMFEVLQDIAFFIKCEPVTLENGENGIYPRCMVGNRLDEDSLHRPPNELDERQLNAYGMMKYYGTELGYQDIYFTAEDEAMLRNLFENCTIVSSTDDAVLSIMIEEASMYFSGARSAEKTVKIIENRVKTRINE